MRLCAEAAVCCKDAICKRDLKDPRETTKRESASLNKEKSCGQRKKLGALHLACASAHLSGVQVRHADSPPERAAPRVQHMGTADGTAPTRVETRVRVRAPAVEVKLKVPELAVATASSAHLDADPSAHLASHLDELRMELSSQRAHIESMRAQLHAVETREATSSAQIKELRKELGSRNRIKYVLRRSAASETHAADESELAHMYVGSGTAPSKS